MTFKIFISYSQDDFLGRARKIRNYLAKVISNSYVYIDQMKLKGDDWRAMNDSELLKSDLMVLVITPAVLQSDQVKREIGLAQKSKIRILPCKHDDLQMSWNDLPLDLGKIDGVEFEDDEILKTRLYREITTITGSEKPKDLAYGVGWGITEVILDNQSFQVLYDTVGGNFLSVNAKVDRDTSSIIFFTRCTIVTDVTFKIPRKLIDAKSSGKDDKFFILLDNTETFFEELSSDDKIRNLKVTCPPNVKEIEVIGTEILGISLGKRTQEEHIIRLLKGSSSPDNEKFAEPETLKVKQGDTVTWMNEDSAAHTVTSGTISNGTSGIFDSSLFGPETSFSVTFEKKGRYHYFCMVHPWKECEIIVE